MAAAVNAPGEAVDAAQYRYAICRNVMQYAVELNNVLENVPNDWMKTLWHGAELLFYARCFERHDNNTADPFSTEAMARTLAAIQTQDQRYRERLQEVHNFNLRYANEVVVHPLYAAPPLPLMLVVGGTREPYMLERSMYGDPTEPRELFLVMRNFFRTLSVNPPQQPPAQQLTQEWLQNLVEACNNVGPPPDGLIIFFGLTFEFPPAHELPAGIQVQLNGCKAAVDYFSILADLRKAVIMLEDHRDRVKTDPRKFASLLAAVELYRGCFTSGRRQPLAIADIFPDEEDNLRMLHTALLAYRNNVLRHSPLAFAPGDPANHNNIELVGLSARAVGAILTLIHGVFAHARHQYDAAFRELPAVAGETTLAEFVAGLPDQFAFLLPSHDRGQGAVPPPNDRIPSLLEFNDNLDAGADDGEDPVFGLFDE